MEMLGVSRIDISMISGFKTKRVLDYIICKKFQIKVLFSPKGPNGEEN